MNGATPESHITKLPEGEKGDITKRIEEMALLNTVREMGQLVESAVRGILALAWIAALVVVWLFLNAFACMAFLGHEAMLPDRAVLATKTLRGNFSTFPRSVCSFLHVLTLRDWPELVEPLAQHAPTTLVLVILHAAVNWLPS